MKDEEAKRLAEDVFREHRNKCEQCLKYDGTSSKLGNLCLRGVELYRETKKFHVEQDKQ